MTFDGTRFVRFVPPRLAGFADALAFIQDVQDPVHPTLIALDQPTIVRNASGMRPAERAVASVISWSGGGIQPANRGRIGLFDDEAPIWPFLAALGATDDPERSRMATEGCFIMEVYPALAILSLDARFRGRKQRPHYNTSRRQTFKQDDWNAVVDTTRGEATSLGAYEACGWLDTLKGLSKPKKADQDKLDALICLLVAIRWRRAPRDASIMIGDLDDGYIVAPIDQAIHGRLVIASARVGVAMR